MREPLGRPDRIGWIGSPEPPIRRPPVGQSPVQDQSVPFIVETFQLHIRTVNCQHSGKKEERKKEIEMDDPCFKPSRGPHEAAMSGRA